MTAAESREPRPLVLSPAWRELAMVAAKTRRDWAWEDTRTALLAAETAHWSFERAFREVCRLVLDPEGAPSDLRNAVRAERPQPKAGPQVAARGRELARQLYDAKYQPRQEAGDGNREGDE